MLKTVLLIHEFQKFKIWWFLNYLSEYFLLTAPVTEIQGNI